MGLSHVEIQFIRAELREEGDAERMADTMLKSEKVNVLFPDLSRFLGVLLVVGGSTS